MTATKGMRAEYLQANLSSQELEGHVQCANAFSNFLSSCCTLPLKRSTPLALPSCPFWFICHGYFKSPTESAVLHLQHVFKHLSRHTKYKVNLKTRYKSPMFCYLFQNEKDSNKKHQFLCLVSPKIPKVITFTINRTPNAGARAVHLMK